MGYYSAWVWSRSQRILEEDREVGSEWKGRKGDLLFPNFKYM